MGEDITLTPDFPAWLHSTKRRAGSRVLKRKHKKTSTASS